MASYQRRLREDRKADAKASQMEGRMLGEGQDEKDPEGNV